jgi:hypothetical protein
MMEAATQNTAIHLRTHRRENLKSYLDYIIVIGFNARLEI